MTAILATKMKFEDTVLNLEVYGVNSGKQISHSQMIPLMSAVKLWQWYTKTGAYHMH